MGTVLRRPQFLSDIFEIWQFIASDSPKRADAFVFELEKRYMLLSERPLLGALRFPNYPSLRLFAFRKYLIIYEPLADNSGVELIRLLHAARDYHRFFDD